MQCHLSNIQRRQITHREESKKAQKYWAMSGDIMRMKYPVNNNNTTNKENIVAKLVAIIKHEPPYLRWKNPIKSDPSSLF